MDVLRKEINGFYMSQNLAAEVLDADVLENCRREVRTAVAVDGDCRVITDAAADRCFVYGGSLAGILGLGEASDFCGKFDSGDEDIIYSRIHPEDLVEKRILEYRFFCFAGKLPDRDKLKYKATCRIRIRNKRGDYIYVENSTQVMRKSPGGKIWIILCRYSLSPLQEQIPDIIPRIMDMYSGGITVVSPQKNKSRLLTAREKEILNLIKDGKLSKQIAGILGISIHTVNRHRQNILEKLSVGNSMEAVMAAAAMKLL